MLGQQPQQPQPRRGITFIEGIFVGAAIVGTTFGIAKAYFEHKHAREAYEESVRQEVRRKLRRR